MSIRSVLTHTGQLTELLMVAAKAVFSRGHRWCIVPVETLAQSAAMGANPPITAALFSAFLKCPTKARLMATDEPAPGTYFTDIETRISSMYKSVAKRRLHIQADVGEPLDFEHMRQNSDQASITHALDCETAVYDFALPQQRPEERQQQEPPDPITMSPSCFYPGISRTFPTACGCVSVRSRCRRLLGYWQTPEH
jgi:hypothetical protein